jgi:hypothetical protein
MNRHWDILQTNEASARFFRFLLGERAATAPTNLLRRMFHPDALRPFVANWEEVAEALIGRVFRESLGGVQDEGTKSLLAEILGYPGVPQKWRDLDPSVPLLPVVPVRFRKGDRRFDFFSTVTTLGTPQDVTVQEIRLECFFPADDETEQMARRLSPRAS